MTLACPAISALSVDTTLVLHYSEGVDTTLVLRYSEGVICSVAVRARCSNTLVRLNNSRTPFLVECD